MQLKFLWPPNELRITLSTELAALIYFAESQSLQPSLPFRVLILFLMLLMPFSNMGQVIKGTITDASGDEIPYASVYVRELSLGTAATIDGVFSINVSSGKYNLVFQSLGFNPETRSVEVTEDDVELSIVLQMRVYNLAAVKISSKSEDPAYSIVRKAIGMAPYYQRQVNSYEADVYIKGSARVNKLSRLIKRQLRKEPDAPKEGENYVYESQNTLTFSAPSTYNQKVIAARSTFPGVDGQMSIGFLTTSFYQPTFAAFISPLAPNALTHYNYKYLGSSVENDRFIHRIEFTPKRKNSKLLSGTLHIVGSLYCLHSFEAKGDYFPGKFDLRVQFAEVQQNVWIPVSQSIDVDIQALGNKGEVTYITSVKYTNLVADGKELALSDPDKKPSEVPDEQEPEPKPISKREVRKQQELDELLEKEELTNREMNRLVGLLSEQKRDTSKSLELEERSRVQLDSLAYSRDTVKWDKIRPVPLQEHERKSFQVRDSLMARISTDSLSKRRSPEISSRKPLARVMLLGGYYASKNKKWRFNTEGIHPFYQGFNTVDGFVPGYQFTTRYNLVKLKTVIRWKMDLSYSTMRKEPMASVHTGFGYWPKQRGYFGLQANYGSRNFNSADGIHPFANTVTTLFLRQNPLKLYHEKQVGIINNIDLANGLMLIAGVSFYSRDTLWNTTDYSFFYKEQRAFDSNLPDNPSFDQTVKTIDLGGSVSATIHYTPRYYYRMYGTRKVMVRSRYPTFSFRFKINHYGSDLGLSPAMMELGIKQSIDLTVFRKFSYQVKAGGFLGNSNLHFADFKHFNTQPIWIVLNEKEESFMLLPFYRHSSSGSWLQGGLVYSAPFIALKYLPLFSNLIWNEAIFLNVLTTNFLPWYAEFGYGATEILGNFNVAGYVGFMPNEKPMFGFRIGYKFGQRSVSVP